MPHRCMNCGEIYDDESEELIQGCECGSNLFLFAQEFDEDEDLDDLHEQRDEIVKDVDKLLVEAKAKAAEKAAVKFDLSSIKVPEDGVYEINLKKLLEEVPIIAEVKEDGSYFLHLASVFAKGRQDSKSLSMRDIQEMSEDVVDAAIQSSDTE